MFAATCPTNCLSIPSTEILVFPSTLKVIPSTASISTGCEYPKDKVNPFPLACTLYPTPTNSNPLENPSLTPTIILFKFALVVPWRALILGKSFGLSNVISLPSIFTLISLLNSLTNCPFGPFTVKVWPSCLTSTPAGIVIGLLPILDIVYPPNL